MEERIEIFKDNTTKVEILKVFDDFLRSLKTKNLQLTKPQFNILMDLILKELRQSSFISDNPSDFSFQLRTSSSVPIIEQGKSLCLVEDFAVFDTAFSLLSLWDEENKEDLKHLIEEHYLCKEISFEMNIFSTPIYGVHGYMASRKENQLLIALFALDENIEEKN